MAKKSKGKKGGSNREVLVVTSKVKAYIKSKKCMTASDTIQALNDRIYALLEEATKRTLANRRSTVKPQDI
jgi:predicted transcriptional regulator